MHNIFNIFKKQNEYTKDIFDVFKDNIENEFEVIKNLRNLQIDFLKERNNSEKNDLAIYDVCIKKIDAKILKNKCESNKISFIQIVSLEKLYKEKQIAFIDNFNNQLKIMDKMFNINIKAPFKMVNKEYRIDKGYLSMLYSNIEKVEQQYNKVHKEFENQYHVYKIKNKDKSLEQVRKIEQQLQTVEEKYVDAVQRYNLETRDLYYFKLPNHLANLKNLHYSYYYLLHDFVQNLKHFHHETEDTSLFLVHQLNDLQTNRENIDFSKVTLHKILKKYDISTRYKIPSKIDYRLLPNIDIDNPAAARESSVRRGPSSIRPAPWQKISSRRGTMNTRREYESWKHFQAPSNQIKRGNRRSNEVGSNIHRAGNGDTSDGSNDENIQIKRKNEKSYENKTPQKRPSKGPGETNATKDLKKVPPLRPSSPPGEGTNKRLNTDKKVDNSQRRPPRRPSKGPGEGSRNQILKTENKLDSSEQRPPKRPGEIKPTKDFKKEPPVGPSSPTGENKNQILSTENKLENIQRRPPRRPPNIPGKSNSTNDLKKEPPARPTSPPGEGRNQILNTDNKFDNCQQRPPKRPSKGPGEINPTKDLKKEPPVRPSSPPGKGKNQILNADNKIDNSQRKSPKRPSKEPGESNRTKDLKHEPPVRPSSPSCEGKNKYLNSDNKIKPTNHPPKRPLKLPGDETRVDSPAIKANIAKKPTTPMPSKNGTHQQTQKSSKQNSPKPNNSPTARSPPRTIKTKSPSRPKNLPKKKTKSKGKTKNKRKRH